MYFRDKLDVNRAVESSSKGGRLNEGDQGFADARTVYDLYHGKLAEIKSSLNGRGVLFDIHGQVW